MKTQIQIEINDELVVIEVADTEFAKKWLEYFKSIISKQYNWNFSPVALNGKVPDIDLKSIEYVKKLLLAFNKLNSRYNLQFEESIGLLENTLKEIQDRPADKPVKISQGLLNRWHRNFTSLMTNHLYNNIQIDLNDAEVFELIHSMNEYVHRLETICSYPFLSRRTQFADKPIFYSYITNANDPALSEELWSTKNAVYIKDHFDPLIDDCNYSVWLNEDILGKDLIRCWLDFDNKHCSDITGNLFMTPGLILDPHYNYKQILTSQEWLESYAKTHKTLDRFPIGNIVNKPDWEKLNSTWNFSIKSINIVEK